MFFKVKKKSGYVYTEILLMLVSLSVIGGVIILSFLSVSTVNSNYEDLYENDLYYEFPVVYVNTFLNWRLSDDEIKQVGGDVLYVKDLLYRGDEKAMSLVLKKKSEYNRWLVLDVENVHLSYRRFSDDDYSVDDLLDILSPVEVSSLPDLDSLIVDKNYAFYMLNSDGKYWVVYFKGRGGGSELSEKVEEALK